MANYYIHKNGIITMIKGDTFEFNIYIEDDTLLEEEFDYYRLKGDDKLYFIIMPPNADWDHCVYEAEFDKDDVVTETPIGGYCYVPVVLNPDDTRYLPSGLYYYTVKLHVDHYEDPETSESSEGTHIDKWITIIPKTKFNLVE